MPGNTGTGAVLEKMVLPALRHGGYTVTTQVHIGQRLGGGRHVVDVVASESGGVTHLISLKWQQVSGTAEQKVPFEVICLAHAIATGSGKFAKGYVVLGGEGWRLREFYTSGLLPRYLSNIESVIVTKLEDFVARANRGEL